MIQSLVEHLARNAKLETSIDVERFEATLGQIAELRDPRAIGLLLPFFNDGCKFHETMFSIIHTIEAFDDTTYVHELIPKLPEFWARSPYWATVVHYGILNSPATLSAYRDELQFANPLVKQACRELLTSVVQKKPQLKSKCDELLCAIERQE